jgi:NAD(P)-dependent dehydrogenase (short-subunit alcohol dehydrogenase family)
VLQEAAKRMRDADTPGSIINIASIVGLRGSRNLATYAISKAAMISMTKSAALELVSFSLFYT